MDTIALHGYRFMVAFLAHDRALMAREAQEINAHPDLFTEIGLVEANAAAAEGRLREMREADRERRTARKRRLESGRALVESRARGVARRAADRDRSRRS